MKLAAFDEEIEELRMRFEPAVRHFFHKRFQLTPFRPREQGDARAFDGRVADLHDFRGADSDADGLVQPDETHMRDEVS